MPRAEITADTRALAQLGKDLGEAKRALLGRLAERGGQVLRDEIPYETGNLKQGVAPPDVDYEHLEALLTVSARSASSGAGVAQVFGKDGKLKKSVSLRPSPAYNYAEVVAMGNKEATLTPTHAKAFLIPVATAPTGEGYLLIGGLVYVVRRSKKGMKGDPYDTRAAKRLQEEAPGIATAVLEQFV